MHAMATLTADDLLTLPPPPGGGYYESSDGQLITAPRAGFEHEIVKDNGYGTLRDYVRPRDLGRVFAQARFPTVRGARVPDVAFVSKAKLLSAPVTKKAIPFTPDLVMEVISTSELAEEAERKVREYLASGVQELWQFYPGERFVAVRTLQGSHHLELDGVLTTSLLPGWQATVRVFFEGLP